MIEEFKPFPFNEMPIIGIMETKKKKKLKKERLEKTPPPDRGGHKEHRFLHGEKRSQRRVH